MFCDNFFSKFILLVTITYKRRGAKKANCKLTFNFPNFRQFEETNGLLN